MVVLRGIFLPNIYDIFLYVCMKTFALGLSYCKVEGDTISLTSANQYPSYIRL